MKKGSNGPLTKARRAVAEARHGTGNGITFSAIAAPVIQRAILGLADPAADLFARAR